MSTWYVVIIFICAVCMALINLLDCWKDGAELLHVRIIAKHFSKHFFDTLTFLQAVTFYKHTFRNTTKMWSVNVVLISYVAIFSTTSGTPRKFDRESCAPTAAITRSCSHRSEAALADLKRSINTIKFDCGEVCDTSSKIEKKRGFL